MSDIIKKVDSELVPESENTKLEIRKKPKLMNLETSKEYLDKFQNMTPKEINEFIDKQSDLLLMYSKNAALEMLAKAVETGDEGALEMYLKLIQASAVVTQEKLSTKKALGIDEGENKPKQYVAEDESPEEWEKRYKPGTQPSNDKPEVFIAPSNNTVN